MVLVQSSLDPITVIDKLKDLVASEPWQVRYILRVLTVQLVVPIFFFFKQKTAYEITVGLEFRRVLFRSNNRGRRCRQSLGKRISIASSTVMIPSISPDSSITGSASRLYSAILCATSRAGSPACAR